MSEERHAEQEVKAAMKTLLRSLTEVRNQQRVGAQGADHKNGVVDGLNIAIAAIRRRIR